MPSEAEGTHDGDKVACVLIVRVLDEGNGCSIR
jgi:hypothetical protein